nr:hypothetical protein [Tanacetum cinerariifolium]
MEQDYIDEYNVNLMLKAELAKKEHMIEKKFFDEVILRCSRLQNHSANLDLKLQHQNESFFNNRSLKNQNALEILEFFKINEWQAKLDAKVVPIANSRKHIRSFKGKSCPNVIDPGMFKLDLEPLSPKVLNNKDAYIDYIKHSRENVNTLWKIVEHTRALRPLDSDLDSACTVRFGNDQIAKIMGYRDSQMGKVTISWVYYVEGFGHNLFCDSDLEEAFRKHTYYIRDLESVELLKGLRAQIYTLCL